MKVGVLALQGAFARHISVLETLGTTAVEVRQPPHLDGIDALVLPGGESTTISMMLERTGLFDPLRDRLAEGMPAFGTCAGMILLGAAVLDGRADQRSFGAIDLDVRRNAYGRQVDSFETDLEVDGFDLPYHAVFIRAPGVARCGPSVEVLAAVGDQPVLCRQGPVLASSFHPELTHDDRIHRLFLEQV